MSRSTDARRTALINPNKPANPLHAPPTATLRDLQARLSQDLPRLLPLWPHEIDIITVASRKALQSKLAKVLRAERTRGHTNHWAYDLARHTQLLKAYRALTNIGESRIAVTTPGTKKAAGVENLQLPKKI